jgi:glycosyltransferase involved in cell wall biosynthesis
MAANIRNESRLCFLIDCFPEASRVSWPYRENWRINSIQKVGMPREKIEVVRNGIRVGDFISSPLESAGDDVVIGVIARLAAVKDIPTLLQAMDIVLQTESKVRLQIVGDGPERASLEALSVKLGTAKPRNVFGFSPRHPGPVIALRHFRSHFS